MVLKKSGLKRKCLKPKITFQIHFFGRILNTQIFLEICTYIMEIFYINIFVYLFLWFILNHKIDVIKM